MVASLKRDTQGTCFYIARVDSQCLVLRITERRGHLARRSFDSSAQHLAVHE